MYNHINFFDLNKLGQNKNQLEKTNIEIVTPIEALSKGNMDKNLYNQFENYQPVLLNKNNPNDMLKAYNFMLIDLQLYLDVHPEDENVKELFNEYVRRWHETKENAEQINTYEYSKITFFANYYYQKVRGYVEKNYFKEDK